MDQADSRNQFIPLVLAAVLRIITSSRFNHPLVVPAFFIAVPVVFYIIVLSARIPMQTLRDGGWIFNLEGVNTPWYEYFTLYGQLRSMFSLT